MKFFHLLFLLLTGLGILLSGCATPPVDPSDETVSMIYGYIDMSAAPSALKEVSVRRYSEPAGNVDTNVERNAWAERGGLFWQLGVRPGIYQIYSYGDEKNRFIYNEERQSETAIRIEEPGLYFLGSYSYPVKSAQRSGVDALDLKVAKSPSEVNLLERLIKMMESKKDDRVYLRQYGWLKMRLSELKR
ncbi:MAG: hypothetical protein OEV15_10715 [Gallionella sp.]|nr:hypothetical protein [Gallionella sp.]